MFGFGGANEGQRLMLADLLCVFSGGFTPGYVLFIPLGLLFNET